MIAFTICSNNYLAKARVLLKSLRYKEEVTVYLFLADSKSDKIDYGLLGFDKLILPSELKIDNLQWQLENYNIIEFNTALKAKAFKYIFKNTPQEVAYYFDPDIKVYQPLSCFDKYWENKSILLTPHILSPVPIDGLFPQENLFLNHGIYNLGFIGLRRSSISDNFLSWWDARLKEFCIIHLKEGYFTDQIWINLVPLFFKEVKIIEHPGFNVAYWNLHEREIDFTDGIMKVNKNYDLFFYHFSSFDPSLQKLTPTVKARYNFVDRIELLALYNEYLLDINLYADVDYKSIQYYGGIYPLVIPQKKQSTLRRVISRIFK